MFSVLKSWLFTRKGILISERSISERIKRSKNAVHNAVVKFKKTGTYSDAKRSGRPRKSIPRGDHIIRRTVSTVNYVKARDLNSHMFKQLCITENSNHHTLLMHIAVRWLSRGKTLKKVFLLRRELATFLQDKGHKNARHFPDSQFLARLALLTDVFNMLISLSLNFKGKANGCLIFKGQ